MRLVNCTRIAPALHQTRCNAIRTPKGHCTIAQHPSIALGLLRYRAAAHVLSASVSGMGRATHGA